MKKIIDSFSCGHCSKNFTREGVKIHGEEFIEKERPTFFKNPHEYHHFTEEVEE